MFDPWPLGPLAAGDRHLDKSLASTSRSAQRDGKQTCGIPPSINQNKTLLHCFHDLSRLGAFPNRSHVHPTEVVRKEKSPWCHTLGVAPKKALSMEQVCGYSPSNFLEEDFCTLRLPWVSCACSTRVKPRRVQGNQSTALPSLALSVSKLP